MNGGRNAIKGYLFQYLICILDSFQSNNWSRIIIEPNIDAEKTDILYFLKDSNGEEYQKAVQVKSKSDYFNAKEVKRLADELKNTYQDAEKHELILVGHCLSTAMDYLRDNKYQPEGVDIPRPKIYDLDSFIGNACHKLEKYINENFATQLPGRYREDMVYSLIGKFEHYSTDGREITRNQFEADLQHWIQSYVSPNDYELIADAEFSRRYGFNAPPNKRIAIEKLYKQSGEIRRDFFKKCINFLTIDVNSRKLKVIYPKVDMSTLR